MFLSCKRNEALQNASIKTVIIIIINFIIIIIIIIIIGHGFDSRSSLNFFRFLLFNRLG